MRQYLELLLRLIQADAGVAELLGRGLRYSQIAALMASAEAEGLTFVDPESGRVSLTKEGLAALRVSTISGRTRKDGGFILPLAEVKIDKLPLDGVYLPPRRKSFFGLDRSASPFAQQREDGDSPS